MTRDPEKHRAQSREGVARLRERKRAAGLVLKQVWVHPDDWPEIRDTIDRKASERETL